VAYWKTSVLLFVLFTLSMQQRVVCSINLLMAERVYFIYIYIYIYLARTSRTAHSVNNRKVKSVSDSLKN
jgi:hypothetical protein